MGIGDGVIPAILNCEIYDDIGEIKETMYVYADALVYGDVKYTYRYPVSEIELAAWKIADVSSNNILVFFSKLKLNQIVQNLEENGVIIFDKNVMIDKKEKKIAFIGTVKTREQIGINIPVEEIREYEFE